VGRPALGVQDDRLPVVPLVGAPERLDAVAATGVSFARVDLFWSDIAPTAPADPEDPDDPGYDWSRADSVLRGFVARGITPLVSFYSTPAWLAGEGPPAGTPVNPAIPDPSAVADFATALVTRYSGRHVPPGATAPLPRLRYLEIWNEPNKVAFLAPKTDGDGNPISLEAYVDMAEAAHAAVKAVDPDVFVLVGALGSGGDARDFLDRIISEDLGADGVSQHLYPAADPLREFAGVIPYPSWQSLPEIVGKLDAWRPGIPLFITEAGYTTAETPFRPPGSSVSEAEQASRLRDIAEVPLVKSGRIGAVVWFNFQDNPGWPAGLLREGDPVSSPSLRKPSYSVFLDLAEIRGAVPPPALGESPPG
jgi:hypothetical protein